MSKLGKAWSLMGSLKDVKRVRKEFDDSSRAMPPELAFPPDEVRPPTTDARTVLLRVVNGGSAQDDAFAIIHVPASKSSLSVLVLNPRTIIEAGITLGQLTDESGDAITVAIVEDILRVRIDHVLHLGADALVRIVGSLGPLAVYSRGGFAAFGHEFTEGTNHLDASSAGAFFTADPIDDAGQTRTRNQRSLLRSLIAAIDVRQLAGDSDALVDLLQTFVNGARRDQGLTSDHVVGLATDLRNLGREAVTTITIPAQSTRHDDGAVTVQFIAEGLTGLRTAIGSGTPGETVAALAARGF